MGTLQNSAILALSSLLNERSVRQTRMSGWTPICRNWPTDARRLGLQFGGRLEIRNQRQMDVEAVLLADVERELANGLEKRLALDVADRAADFGDHHIDVLSGRFAHAALISLVMWGMTWTVLPRYSPRRSFSITER